MFVFNDEYGEIYCVGQRVTKFVKEQHDDEKRRLDDERVERQRERESKKLEAEERDCIRLRELVAKEKEWQMQEREKEAQR